MQKSRHYLYVIIFGLALISSCKKSSDDSNDGPDPCAGIVAVTASGLPAPAADTFRLYASTVTGATYAWSGPNNFTSHIQNPIVPNVTAASNGSYKVTATVGGCVKEASVSLSTFTYATPPCSPLLSTYTIGSVNNNLGSINNDISNPGGPYISFQAQTAGKYADMYFAPDALDGNGKLKDGVYKIVSVPTVTSGHVHIMVAEITIGYASTLGFVCVKNFLSNGVDPACWFTWCSVKMEELSGSDVLTTSGSMVLVY